jgi:hypothetical protein
MRRRECPFRKGGRIVQKDSMILFVKKYWGNKVRRVFRVVPEFFFSRGSVAFPDDFLSIGLYSISRVKSEAELSRSSEAHECRNKSPFMFHIKFDSCDTSALWAQGRRRSKGCWKRSRFDVGDVPLLWAKFDTSLKAGMFPRVAVST